MDANGGNRQVKGAGSHLETGETDKYVGFLDIETDTNPIDRSIAHLLFQRPSDSSLSSDHDVLSYKSHPMIPQPNSSPSLRIENQEETQELRTEAVACDNNISFSTWKSQRRKPSCCFVEQLIEKVDGFAAVFPVGCEKPSKGDGVVLAKIDPTEENELAHQYSVQGFLTILFFVDGEHKPYNGGRTKETIVTWVKKKIGPGVYNLTTLDDAEKVLTSGNKVILGYLNSLVGVERFSWCQISLLQLLGWRDVKW
ncbi:Thioredoxin-like fold protein [Raphanus sativus]|nr:Thioredoxin domain protein [Raphanus sativus]KAJ4881151.1 Thioredoxin-like fold protein [Raphanus sativus]